MTIKCSQNEHDMNLFQQLWTDDSPDLRSLVFQKLKSRLNILRCIFYVMLDLNFEEEFEIVTIFEAGYFSRYDSLFHCN